MRAQAKHWVFTLNDEDERLSYEEVVDFIGPHCEYLVFQEERGENGTKHYQGYAEFKKPHRITSIQRFHKTLRPHWEKRKGTRDQARDYAMKEATRVDGPWESGERAWSQKPGKRGQRSDLLALATSVRDGKTDLEIFEEFPAQTLVHLKHIQNLRMVIKPERSEELNVCLLYGPPGTGKTRSFYELFPDGYAIPVSKNLWFSNYQQQRACLIDDFSGQVGLAQLLQILDRYPVQVETKGGHVWWCPDTICITSNLHPWEWYDYSTRTDSYRALKRRFSKAVHFRDADTPNSELEIEDFFENQKPTHTRFDKTHCDGQ